MREVNVIGAAAGCSISGAGNGRQVSPVFMAIEQVRNALQQLEGMIGNVFNRLDGHVRPPPPLMAGANQTRADHPATFGAAQAPANGSSQAVGEIDSLRDHAHRLHERLEDLLNRLET